MRRLVLLAAGLPTIALAQSARAEPAPTSTPANSDKPTDEKPKGRIADPWARIPHPRDHMHLPSPRAAAEKTAANGTVVPVSPDPAEPPREPQVRATPAAAPVPPPPAAPVVPLPPPPTPFGTTTFSAVSPPPAPHDGLTLEAGTGVGWIHISERNRALTTPRGVAGLSIGVGGWLDEQIALTARIAGSSAPTAEGVIVAAFLGPSMQIWLDDSTWLGFGIGLFSCGLDGNRANASASLGGFAGDFRAGHTFYANGRHTLNASLELTPGRVSEEGAYGTDLSLNVTSIGLLFGWQYL